MNTCPEPSISQWWWHGPGCQVPEGQVYICFLANISPTSYIENPPHICTYLISRPQGTVERAQGWAGGRHSQPSFAIGALWRPAGRPAALGLQVPSADGTGVWKSASLPESLTRHTGPTWYAVMREICVQITKIITALYKKQCKQYRTISWRKCWKLWYSPSLFRAHP